MAESAGQITASLTLDISNFKKALSEAQSAVDKMTGGRGAGGGGPLGGGKQANENKKLAASLRMVSSSYTSLNRAVAASVVDAKKAATQYSRLEDQLRSLEPQVKNDQKAINALNNALSAKKGSEIFRKNQADAKMAAENMANSIGNSSSKVGSFFKVMGAGIASGSRGIVMSLTNITEAFQKGQMGGRMLSTFLLGDLMDAFMIGTFVADGFRKAAASLGPAMAAQAAMMRGLAGIFPWMAMGLSALAAAIGYFVGESDKASKAAALQKKSLEELSGAASVTSGNVEILADSYDDLVSGMNSAQQIELDKILDPVDALASAVNKLDKMQLKGPQIAAIKMANFFSVAYEEAQNLVREVNRLNAALSKGGKESAKLTGMISARANELQLLEAAGVNKARQKQLEQEIQLLSQQRSEIDAQRAANAKDLEVNKQALEEQKKRVQQGIKARKEYEKIIKLIEKEEAKRKKRKSTPESDHLKMMRSAMKEEIALAQKLRQEIARVEAANVAAGAARTDISKSDPRLKQLQEAERQIREISKEYTTLNPLADEYFSTAPDDKKRAQLAKEAEELKSIMDLISKASDLGIEAKFITLMDPDAKKALEQQVKTRGGVVNFLAPLVGGAKIAVKALKKLDTNVNNVSNNILNNLGENADDFAGKIKSAAEAVVAFTTGAFTAAAAMTGTLGQAAMGQFGGFMSGALGALGAGIGAAKGAPEVGQQVGTALGSFADLGISKIEVTSDIVDMETGQLVAVNLMEIIGKEFNEALKPAVDALRPFGNLVFYVATRLGTMLSHLTVALEPLISFIGETLLFAFQFTYVQLSALIPIIAAVANVFSGPLTWSMQWLTGVTRNLGIVFANVAIFLGKFLQDMAEQLGDIPIIGDMARRLGEMGETLTNGAVTFANGLVSSLGDLDPQIRQAANNYARQNQNMEKANREASKVLNAPKGFKVEKYRYEAMNPEQSNPFNSSLNGQTTGNMSVMIEAIYVADGDDLLERLDEAKRTGGFSPLGGN